MIRPHWPPRVRARVAMAWRVERRAVSLKLAAGGLGGELGHLLDARLVEASAPAVLPPEEAGVLITVSAGSHGSVL